VDDSAAQSLDERYRLLSVARRRVTLDVLTDQSESIELTALARLVTAIEHDGNADEVDPATRERVAVSLHHVHLPKMDDFGVVEYDTDTREVEPCMSRIQSLLA
jgi:hypothetical protein